MRLFQHRQNGRNGVGADSSFLVGGSSDPLAVVDPYGYTLDSGYDSQGNYIGLDPQTIAAGGGTGWLDSGIEWVQQQSASGASTTGEISNTLLQLGLTVGQISAVLSGVANSPITTQQQAAAIAQEQAYLAAQKQSQNKLLLGIFAAAAIIYFAMESEA